MLVYSARRYCMVAISIGGSIHIQSFIVRFPVIVRLDSPTMSQIDLLFQQSLWFCSAPRSKSTDCIDKPLSLCSTNKVVLVALGLDLTYSLHYRINSNI